MSDVCWCLPAAWADPSGKLPCFSQQVCKYYLSVFSKPQSAPGAKQQARLKLNWWLLMAGYVPVQPGTCAAAQQ